MITKEQALARAKSLRWVVNQIPEDLDSTSNEERKLLRIRQYCAQGADAIEQLYQVSILRCGHCRKSIHKPTIRHSGPHIGLFCEHCGKFQKWVSKRELYELGYSDDGDDIPF